MSDKTNKSTEEAKIAPQYSDEEMTQMRVKMKQFYEEELPYLKLQEEYERLQADVEEHKVRRMTMMIRGAQIFDAGKDAEKADKTGTPGQVDETGTPGERKLKED